MDVYATWIKKNDHKICRAYIDGLVQDCSNSIAYALELLQFCTKPSIYSTCMYVLSDNCIRLFRYVCDDLVIAVIQLNIIKVFRAIN